MEQAKQSINWPPDPYKGLTYYDKNDYPLFSGRQADVQRVGRILGDGGNRILLLHGSTACGKSSFLRAALIPFLVDQAGRFTFAKVAGADVALLVRSFHDPLLELAAKTWELVKNEEHSAAAEPSTPDAPAAEDIAPVEEEALHRYAVGPVIDFKQYDTVQKFTAAVLDDPDKLVDTIGRRTYRLPRTQALIVDQGEELLTLKPGVEGNDARRRFFMFLAYLSCSDINFRLIIAFRTEYHGRFYAAMKAGGINASSVGDYFLDELKGRDLIDAIERPTSEDEIPGYGVPRNHYRFYYEPGLALEIARRLEETRLVGGLLPVLQIVCRRLYQKALKSPQVKIVGKDGFFWVIRHKDFDDLQGIQGQVDLHLQEGLEKCCEDQAEKVKLTAIGRKLESMRWRGVLCTLAKPQADGTVTTDVKDAKILAELARFRGCKMEFRAAMEFLKKDEWKIVRPVDLTKANGDSVLCYCLGHDVLGGVLEAWKQTRDRDTKEIRKSFWVTAALVIGASFAVTSFVEAVDLPGPLAVSAEVLATVKQVLRVTGVLYFVLAVIPDKPWSAFLYKPLVGVVSDVRGLKRLPGRSSLGDLIPNTEIFIELFRWFAHTDKDPKPPG